MEFISYYVSHETTVTGESVFPLELVDYIAGFMWNDAPTIRAYSATCRSYYEMVRPFLYRRLVLWDDEDIRLSKLGKFLNSNPDVCLWVRELRARIADNHDSAATSIWIPSIPLVLAKKLPNLRTIEFVDTRLYRFYGDWKSLHDFAGFTGVTSLSFINCYMPSDLVDAILKLLPNVQSFHLHNHEVSPNKAIHDEWGVEWFNGWSRSPGNWPSNPQLASFMIHQDQFQHPRYQLPKLLTFVNQSASMTTLNTVHVLLRYPSDVREFAQFIKSLGCTLENLDVKFCETGEMGRAQEQADLVKQIDLSNCSGLRSLRFHNPRHPVVMHMLPQAQIASPYLNQVSFSLSLRSLRCLRSSEYVCLDECLASSNFRDLEEARFVYDGPIAEDLVRDKMKRVLRRSTTRGIVKVSKFARFPGEKKDCRKLS